jgi:hypothetical protein
MPSNCAFMPSLNRSLHHFSKASIASLITPIIHHPLRVRSRVCRI